MKQLIANLTKQSHDKPLAVAILILASITVVGFATAIKAVSG